MANVLYCIEVTLKLLSSVWNADFHDFVEYFSAICGITNILCILYFVIRLVRWHQFKDMKTFNRSYRLMSNIIYDSQLFVLTSPKTMTSIVQYPSSSSFMELCWIFRVLLVHDDLMKYQFRTSQRSWNSFRKNILVWQCEQNKKHKKVFTEIITLVKSFYLRLKSTNSQHRNDRYSRACNHLTFTSQ